MLQGRLKPMKTFKGFSNTETFTPLPDTFFRRLLKGIDSAAELKVALFAIWRIQQMDGRFKALHPEDFDPAALGLSPEELQLGLAAAVERGILLRHERQDQVFLFLNSPLGRSSAEAFSHGDWDLEAGELPPSRRLNIFRLYEENIGPLTPLIADMLKEAETLYPAEWLEEGITIAVSNNKRSWKYVEAILKRWKEEGRHGEKDRQDAVKGSERYTNSEFSEFIKGE